MKKQKRLRSQVFVLTPEEKKVIAFVIAAFLLGLAAQHYRAAHPPAPRAELNNEEHRVRKTAKMSASGGRSTRKQLPQPALLTPSPSARNDDDD